MYSYSDRDLSRRGRNANPLQGSSDQSFSKNRLSLRTLVPKHRLFRLSSLAAAPVMAAGIFLAMTGHNEAAACRGAGVSTVQPDGTIVTRWPDGAWKKQYTDRSYEWSIPAGTKPLPGTSPGHPPPN